MNYINGGQSSTIVEKGTPLPHQHEFYIEAPGGQDEVTMTENGIVVQRFFINNPVNTQSFFGVNINVTQDGRITVTGTLNGVPLNIETRTTAVERDTDSDTIRAERDKINQWYGN